MPYPSSTRLLLSNQGMIGDTRCQMVGNEIIAVDRSVAFEEEFFGPMLNFNQWDNSTGKIGSQADGVMGSGGDLANGVYAMAIDSNSEEQCEPLHFSDYTPFILSQEILYYARIRFTGLPTLLGRHIFGLSDAFVKDREGPLMRALFSLESDGSLYITTDDGTVDSGVVDSGVVPLVGTWYDYWIDMTDTASIKFYQNGVQLAAATTFDMSTAPTTWIVQPNFQCYKASGAGIGTMQIDALRVFQTRGT